MLNQLIEFVQNTPALISTVWVFVCGSLVAMLRSAVDGVRRSFGRLLVGSLFGGIGAIIANNTFDESSYKILLIGVSAVIAENIVIGLSNASKKFSTDPWPLLKELFAIIVPGLKQIGDFMKTKNDIDNSYRPPREGDEPDARG